MGFSAVEFARGRLGLMKREILVLGVVGGVLIAVLQWMDYRFLVMEHSEGIFGGLVAVIFSGVGIWLGLKLVKPRVVVETKEVPAAVNFAVDEGRRESLGITPREMEILGLVAEGLSNREIAERLFVSENTVKTHCSRAFDKLGARRLTEAVQMGKQMGLLP